MRQVVNAHATIPGIWLIEVANGLLVAARTRRITAAQRNQAIAALASLDVRIDGEGNQYASTSVMLLSEQHALTAYDAAYLELALRRGLPLATPDRKLRGAAQRAGAPLLGV